MGLGIWGNRAGKGAILLTVAAVVFGTGYLANTGAASPEPVVDDAPAPNFAPQPITVAKGTITSRLVLDATVQAEPPRPVRSEKAGQVTRVLVPDGKRVYRGQAVLAFRYTPEAAEGAKKPPKPQTLYLYASAPGKVTGLAAHVGGSVTPGETAFSIDQGRFRAVATVAAKDVYKLYNEPESIRLQIDHGPAPFGCPLIDYGAGVGTKAAKDDEKPAMDGGDGGGSDVQVTCRIPGNRRVFAGLPGKMSVLTDVARNVPVVPLAAVLGQSGRGVVVVVGADGSRERREIRLGLNDGTRVEVESGLSAGEKILDRAPDDAAFPGPEDKPGGSEPEMMKPGMGG